MSGAFATIRRSFKKGLIIHLNRKNMNTFRLLLLTLFVAAMPIMGFAYTGGQIVTFNQLWYKVLSPTSHTMAKMLRLQLPSCSMNLVMPVME